MLICLNSTREAKGVAHMKGSVVKFTLKIKRWCRSVLLRREFYTVPKQFNQRANISINSEDHGLWFIPMGSIVARYSLMDDDFLIGEEYTQRLAYLDIEIKPLSTWYDISYSVYCIH